MILICIYPKYCYHKKQLFLLNYSFAESKSVLRKWKAAFYDSSTKDKRKLTLSWRRPLSYRNRSIDLLRKISENLLKNTSDGIFFLAKLQVAWKRGIYSQVCSCEFCEIFSNSFFAEHLLQGTASSVWYFFLFLSFNSKLDLYKISFSFGSKREKSYRKNCLGWRNELQRIIQWLCNRDCLVSSFLQPVIFWHNWILNLFFILFINLWFRKCVTYVLGCSYIFILVNGIAFGGYTKNMNCMFDELTEVKYFKGMKSLKSLQVKAEAYLEPKQASMMKLYVKIFHDLISLQRRLHHRCLTWF